MNQKATQVSIFLSPLNVHVNRVPFSGDVEYVKYSPGKYLMAWEDHASEQNERAHFGVKHSSGTKILFKQITGFLARRIVYNLEEGTHVTAGDKFGIMKFGSRMDLILPENVDIMVGKGEKTVAGESIIGKIR
jgi:phosphatidylserine decarboxylase